ncbi:phosphotransferase family protein [Kutzneria kofuensis]|uniref:Aminoglycoside phosphotransferase (APT) family kinase protein n=1 Tax=Kutzneria kofuensis TaxID=103725 RepID=A0A7W9NEK5_9PSEU|nr:aminoglycoside phosphotransferase family protein [Kutzneria kofuensis]MBB5889494.1 aminoglycoside phosphotransferase (APT) family kinase protein [Kutzneria kofuensis]
MTDLARTIAAAALGRDPGPLTATDSLSHDVYLGADVVVKIADGHTRLSREIALAPHLPAGITAPLLASGAHDAVRYACYTRVPGQPPDMNAVEAKTARALAEQAIQRLDRLHDWTPPAEALPTLRETLDHGGFTTQEALHEEIDRLSRHEVPRHLLDGLTAIAKDAPPRAKTTVPVHADCHWDNWLVDGDAVTALLDFEWARFGEPLDDWVFVIRFSGPHMVDVLDLVAEATALSKDVLRRECELREANFLAADLRIALETNPKMAAGNIRDLEEIIVGRYWWRSSSA